MEMKLGSGEENVETRENEAGCICQNSEGWTGVDAALWKTGLQTADWLVSAALTAVIWMVQAEL